ncbi:MAG: hypothetical protein Q4A01_07785 [Coriobacteriales bacterium]|nr:hypothetical protein [Coriobacteriales bacterium]
MDAWEEVAPWARAGPVRAFVMVLGLCPAIALADEVEVEPTGGEEPTIATQGDPVQTPQDGSPYGLYVGDVTVTNEKLSDDGWNYDPDSNTLTLNGYSFDGTESSVNVGIMYEGSDNLTIVLEGANVVKVADAGIVSWTNAGITISGTGTLTAEGGQFGILCYGDQSTLTISGATVTATATTSGLDSSALGAMKVGRGRAIQAGKGITISDATVTATGGEYGIYSGGSLTITDSTVKASATDETGGQNGILANNSFTINSGTVTAESKANYGIYAGEGVVVGKDVTSFIASGNPGAIQNTNTVKNAIAGLGWSDAAGTQGKTGIPVSETGQTLGYMRVRFPVPTHAVTVKADPSAGGTAKASAQKAAEEEAVTLTAKANDGYEFAGWTIEGEGAKIDDASKPEATLTMGAADVTATANFKKKEEPATVPAPIATAHVQRIGWMSAVTDGGLAGTTGKSRRLEALTLKLPDGVSGSIEYCGHVQRSGWEKSYAADGKVAGTEGKSRRLEAVQIRLSGAAKDNYDVYYRVHVQRLGWMGWAKNDEPAGTQGMSRRAEAVQVALVPKGAPAPLATYKGVTQDNAKSFIKK